MKNSGLQVMSNPTLFESFPSYKRSLPGKKLHGRGMRGYQHCYFTRTISNPLAFSTLSNIKLVRYFNSSNFISLPLFIRSHFTIYHAILQAHKTLTVTAHDYKQNFPYSCMVTHATARWLQLSIKVSEMQVPDVSTACLPSKFSCTQNVQFQLEG